MSNPQAPKRPNHYSNITANATLIWHREGPSFDFEIDVETDDDENYQAFLSVIRLDKKNGPTRIQLLPSGQFKSEERAMRDLDDTLKEWVKRGVKKELKPSDLEPFDVGKALALINGALAAR